MPRTILQWVEFKNTKPQALYNLYMNAKKHSIATGALAVISVNEGENYSTHGGYIGGKNLQLIKNKLIVQTWRAQGWNKKDADSTLIIYLESKGNDTILHMTHANIPDEHVESITKGWFNHYWDPWKKYLSGDPIAKAPGM